MARTLSPEKKTAILEAAQRAFAAREFHEVLTEDIAALAGTGKGTLYRYFDTKEELYFATVLRGFDELDAVLEEVRSSASTPPERLGTIAREVLRIFWSRSSFYTILHRDPRRFHTRERLVRRRRERLVRVVENTLDEGIRRGEFRPLDTRIGAELFLGLVRASLVFRRETDVRADLAAQILRTYLSGVTRSDG